jgi:hypothetical protein
VATVVLALAGAPASGRTPLPPPSTIRSLAVEAGRPPIRGRTDGARGRLRQRAGWWPLAFGGGPPVVVAVLLGASHLLRGVAQAVYGVNLLSLRQAAVPDPR